MSRACFVGLPRGRSARDCFVKCAACTVVVSEVCSASIDVTPDDVEMLLFGRRAVCSSTKKFCFGGL